MIFPYGCDIPCGAICPFGTRKGINIISQPNKMRLYRICKAKYNKKHTTKVFMLSVVCCCLNINYSTSTQAWQI